MATEYDVIIGGLGAMGSAAAYQLSLRRRRVLGLDRFEPPHNLGSSHGLTRIIREAYFEHPLYVPLVQRAYELWAELEKQSGRRLLLETGGLMIGPADGVLVSGAKRSAEEHRLAHQVLSSTELRRRYPMLAPAEDMVAVWEPRAGILFPELAIKTQLELAAQNGAQLQFNEPILKWESANDGVRVETANGSYSAKRLVLSAGAWLDSLVPELTLPLKVERQILFWFEPRADAGKFGSDQCPIHLWEYESHKFFYGFPDLDDGVKVAIHHQGETTRPDKIQREVQPADVQAMQQIVLRFLPDADGPIKSAVVCMYTNTPDEHFIIDYHPIHRQVLIVSPCSGHGFKFSPAIGELVCALLDEQAPRYDIGLFAMSRFRQD